MSGCKSDFIVRPAKFVFGTNWDAKPVESPSLNSLCSLPATSTLLVGAFSYFYGALTRVSLDGIMSALGADA